MTLAVLTAGGVLVAALVVWALTRTVEPAAPAAPAAEAAGQPLNPVPTATGGGTEPARPEPEGDPASVPRASVEDLRAKLGGAVTIIDVRQPDSFAVSHIPGAVNMPLSTIEAQVASIPAGRPVVTYCT